MKTVKHYLSFALLLIFATAFMPKQINAATNELVIPDDAYVVVNLDLNAIWNKADLRNSMNLQVVNEIRKELQREMPMVDELVVSTLRDPFSTGLNINENIVLFAAPSAGQTYFVLSAALTNSADMERYLSKISKAAGSDGTLPIYRDNNFTFLNLEDFIAAYTDKRILFVIPESRYQTMEDMRNYAISIFNLPSNRNMTYDLNFKEYWRNRGDFGAYVAYKSIASVTNMLLELYAGDVISDKMMANMMQTSYYLSATFEKGYIQCAIKTIGTSKELKKVFEHSFNKSILKYLPEQTLGAATVSISIDKFMSYYNTMNPNNNIYNMSSGIGSYTFAEILNAFGGSLAFSSYAFDANDEVLYAVVVDINNMPTFKAILEASGYTKNGDFYVLDSYSPRIYLGNNVAVMSNDIKTLNKAMTGGYTNNVKAAYNKLAAGNYFYLGLDLSKFPASALEDLYMEDYYNYYTEEYVTEIDPERKRYVDAVRNMLDYIEVEMFVNDGFVGRLHLTNKNINSLLYIIREFDKLVKFD